jgi:hypothetical protein
MQLPLSLQCRNACKSALHWRGNCQRRLQNRPAIIDYGLPHERASECSLTRGLYIVIYIHVPTNDVSALAYITRLSGDLADILGVPVAVTGQSVCDEGKGLPAGFDFGAQKGLGMKIIDVLATQLGRSVTTGSDNGQGTCLVVTFPRKSSLAIA